MSLIKMNLKTVTILLDVFKIFRNKFYQKLGYDMY